MTQPRSGFDFLADEGNGERTAAVPVDGRPFGISDSSHRPGNTQQQQNFPFFFPSPSVSLGAPNPSQPFTEQPSYPHNVSMGYPGGLRVNRPQNAAPPQFFGTGEVTHVSDIERQMKMTPSHPNESIPPQYGQFNQNRFVAPNHNQSYPHHMQNQPQNHTYPNHPQQGHQGVPFHPFGPSDSFQTSNPPTDDSNSLDQMMSRIRIMAQREQQKRNQQHKGGGGEMNFHPQTQFTAPFYSQVEPNRETNTFNPFATFQANPEPEKRPTERKVQISEPNENSELLQPEPTPHDPRNSKNTNSTHNTKEQGEEVDPLKIILKAPPPDDSRTGVYLTSRTKRILGKLPPLQDRKENRIEKTIQHFLSTITPSPDAKRNREDLLHRLQSYVMSLYPDHSPELHLFGSSANHFALKDHDVDACLTISLSAGQKGEIIEKLADNLPEEAEEINPLIWARVPILKFKDRPTNLQVDICVNNVLALRNTKLCADYASIDARLRPLVLVVKYWAKKRMINSPYNGTLSSYAYVLMIIQYLQTRNPPILPCLQRDIEERTEKVVIQGFDCTYNENISKYRNFGANNRQSIASLLVGFFKLYGFEFDYIHSVICVRTGGFLSKDIKQWMIPTNPRECCFFSLEDPFDTSHNLGRVVDRPGMDTIRSEFERAYKILVKTGDFERATRPFTEENPDTRW